MLRYVEAAADMDTGRYYSLYASDIDGYPPTEIAITCAARADIPPYQVSFFIDPAKGIICDPQSVVLATRTFINGFPAFIPVAGHSAHFG